MDEFRAVLNANPQADMPLGQWLTKDSFLQTAVMLNMDEYVDWSTGEVFFDTGGFAQLLEFANTFPESFERSGMDRMDVEWIDESELIATGRQIMMPMWLSSFEFLQSNTRMFGNDIVFKGFPTDSRNGNSLNVYGTSLAITTECVDKDGAWEFMRTVLTADWQRENIRWDFPTNNTVLMELAEEAMKEPEFAGGGISMMETPGGAMIRTEFENAAVTQAEVDQVLALIHSTTNIASYDQGLIEIITEDASDFFNGRNSAQVAASRIQDRALKLISELS